MRWGWGERLLIVSFRRLPRRKGGKPVLSGECFGHNLGFFGLVLDHGAFLVGERLERSERNMMMEDRFLKRLRKKARRGLRGWPIATIAFYGPNLSQATKVAVGIAPSENAEVKELRDWKVDSGDIRADPGIATGNTGVYGEAWSAIGRDDRRDNRMPSSGRNRLRRRMVSGLRVLAWARSLYRTEAPLIL